MSTKSSISHTTHSCPKVTNLRVTPIGTMVLAAMSTVMVFLGSMIFSPIEMLPMSKFWAALAIGVDIALLIHLTLNYSKVKEMETQANNPLWLLWITLVSLGIIFGEDRLIGYTFIAAGVVLAIAWSLMERRRHRTTDRTDKAVRDD